MRGKTCQNTSDILVFLRKTFTLGKFVIIADLFIAGAITFHLRVLKYYQACYFLKVLQIWRL